MITAIGSVLAIILVIAFGVFAGKKNIINPELSKALSVFVMSFTFPAVLFTSIAKSPVENLMNFSFIFSFFLSLMVLYFVIYFLYYLVFKKSKQVSAMAAFVCTFPNMAFMGIPYLSEVLGSTSLISVAIGNVITSVFMIPITIIYLEGKSGDSSVFLRELSKLVKKPLIIAPVLGIIFAVVRIPVPDFIMHGLEILGSATSPVALFALGLMMVKFKFKLSKDAALNIGLKLIIQPAVAVVFILACGVSGMFAKEIIILTAMPSAVIVSMFAEKYEVYKDETVSTIIGGSVLSIITLVMFTVIANIF